MDQLSSLEDLRSLAQTNFQEFKRHFHYTLQAGTPFTTRAFLKPEDSLNQEKNLDPARVALMLRSTTATLVRLGVDGSQAKRRRAEAAVQPTVLSQVYYWDQLERCLELANPEDGLVIFKAMAEALKDAPFRARSHLIQKVMSFTRWRIQAIEEVPGFFMSAAVPDDCAYISQSRRPANAMQLLAIVDQTGMPPKEDLYSVTIEAIRALKRIGIEDRPEPHQGSTCLHMAAISLATDLFRAFLEEFPDLKETGNRLQTRPLHLAAQSPYPGNVQLLLDAGAQPRPVNQGSSTPLEFAAVVNQVDNAMMLVETGAYNEADVRRACDVLPTAEQVDRLRTFYEAVKARQIIDGAGRNSLHDIAPL